ncbi:MAG: UPF0175 family protein [Bergeyella sp.]
METTLTISLPESVLQTMNLNAEEIVSDMRKEYGCKLYKSGKLTLAQAAELCGVSLYEFVSLLTLSAVPVVDYGVEDLENERHRIFRICV